MTLPTQLPKLPDPPREYSAGPFANWALQLANYFRRVNNGGPIMASSLNLSGLPTSAPATSGEVWHDTATHTLKIVP